VCARFGDVIPAPDVPRDRRHAVGMSSEDYRLHDLRSC
jgi:hypothetical protein